MPELSPEFTISRHGTAFVITLKSADGMNRLTRAKIEALGAEIEKISGQQLSPLIITGNEHFFSVGADLNEIAALSGAAAYNFALAGQRLMNAVDRYPAPVIAAINGYCMGGGLDLALACDIRICSPHAIFGHRGAALGIITGWGGTQRLPRLIGKGRAMQMFIAAEKIHALNAARLGLVDAVSPNPLQAAVEYLELGPHCPPPSAPVS